MNRTRRTTDALPESLQTPSFDPGAVARWWRNGADSAPPCIRFDRTRTRSRPAAPGPCLRLSQVCAGRRAAVLSLPPQRRREPTEPRAAPDQATVVGPRLPARTPSLSASRIGHCGQPETVDAAREHKSAALGGGHSRVPRPGASRCASRHADSRSRRGDTGGVSGAPSDPDCRFAAQRIQVSAQNTPGPWVLPIRGSRRRRLLRRFP